MTSSSNLFAFWIEEFTLKVTSFILRNQQAWAVKSSYTWFNMTIIWQLSLHSNHCLFCTREEWRWACLRSTNQWGGLNPSDGFRSFTHTLINFVLCHSYPNLACCCSERSTTLLLLLQNTMVFNCGMMCLDYCRRQCFIPTHVTSLNIKRLHKICLKTAETEANPKVPSI
jgi:hypothetical protein